MKQTYSQLMEHFVLSEEKQQEIASTMEKERRKQAVPRLIYQFFRQKPQAIGLCLVALLLIFLGIQQLTDQPPQVLTNPIQSYQKIAELEQAAPFALKTPEVAGKATSYSLIDGQVVEITYPNQLTYRVGKSKADILGGLEQEAVFESITNQNQSYELLKQANVYKGILLKKGKINYLLFAENGRTRAEWLTLAQSIK